MKIQRATAQLRTELFRTRLRPKTEGVWITSTFTGQEEGLDAELLDTLDAGVGNFGVSYHYVVLPCGTIEIGRHPMTIGAAGPAYLAHSHIMIAWVGGRDTETGKADYSSITQDQRVAIEELLQALADALQTPLEVIDATDSLEEEINRDEAIYALEAQLNENEASHH